MNKEKIQSALSYFQPERVFIIFGLIYIPFAGIFLNRGTLTYVVLMFYTFVMLMLGLMLLVRFLVKLANYMDGKGTWGSIFLYFWVDYFAVLSLFKVIGFVIATTTPISHNGIMCSFVRFAQALIRSFMLQPLLTYFLIGGVVVAVFGMLVKTTMRMLNEKE